MGSTRRSGGAVVLTGVDSGKGGALVLVGLVGGALVLVPLVCGGVVLVVLVGAA